jgi:hypothetical protein
MEAADGAIAHVLHFLHCLAAVHTLEILTTNGRDIAGLAW